MKKSGLKLDVDFNLIRTAFINALQYACGLDQNHTITEEGEEPNTPRPGLPYMGMKIITPGARFGDDDKTNVPDADGKGTTVWNTGGPRKMTVSFDAYGNSHEEAYNLMSLWQTALDEENTQALLRETGIAVWIIGTVADLSQLLNTGYEGRAHMDCQFGLAMNLTSDLGAMETAVVHGSINTGQGNTVQTETTVTDE